MTGSTGIVKMAVTSGWCFLTEDKYLEISYLESDYHSDG
jgi:hypothetical protein